MSGNVEILETVVISSIELVELIYMFKMRTPGVIMHPFSSKYLLQTFLVQ